MTGLMKRSGKRTVCGMVSSRNRKPPCGKKLVWQRLCTMRRLLCLYSNRPLRELSGLASLAISVRFKDRGRAYEREIVVDARRGVVDAAGAIDSPRSGNEPVWHGDRC